MFSVSSEIYEILSLAFRYVFALMGLLIVIRSYIWLFSERRERHARVRKLPDAGMIGELVVLSSSGSLEENSVLPVPREGVLGSVRSCDIAVPCPGVRRSHLDFSWSDGTGLLLRPRHGCKAVVDGIQITSRSDPFLSPVRHGTFIQVGDAVLRLRVFAGLDPNAGFDSSSVPAGPQPVATVPADQSGCYPEPQYLPRSEPAPFPGPVPESAAVYPPQEFAGSYPETQSAQQTPLFGPGITETNNVSVPSALPSGQDSSHPHARKRRSDRWKEDWSE